MRLRQIITFLVLAVGLVCGPAPVIADADARGPGELAVVARVALRAGPVAQSVVVLLPVAVLPAVTRVASPVPERIGTHSPRSPPAL